jgi:hypothetical protein
MTFRTITRAAAGASLAVAAALPAHAVTTTFVSNMTAAAENNPASVSAGFGFVQVDFDDVALTVAISETWSSLLGGAVNNHIHVATTPGGSGGVVLPFQPTFPYSTGTPGPANGAFSGTFTLSKTSFDSLFSNTVAGLAYVNLHSTYLPGGEIRGFLAAVPEASTYAMMVAGLAALGFVARRRQQA